MFRGEKGVEGDRPDVNVKEVTDRPAHGPYRRENRNRSLFDQGNFIMSTIFRVGVLLGLTLAFAAGAVEAAAQGMGSGPIQTLPWAAKARPKPNKERGADTDIQPADATPAAPLVGDGPVAQPKAQP